MLRRFSTYLFGLLTILAMLIVPALPHHHHDGAMAVNLLDDCCHTHHGTETPATEHHATPCQHNQGIPGEMPTRETKITQETTETQALRLASLAFFLTTDAVFASELRLAQFSRGTSLFLLPPDWGRGAQGLRAPPMM